MLRRRSSGQYCCTRRTWCMGRNARLPGRHQIDYGQLYLPVQRSHAVVGLDEVSLAATCSDAQNVGPSGSAKAPYRRPCRDRWITVCDLLGDGVSLPSAHHPRFPFRAPLSVAITPEPVGWRMGNPTCRLAQGLPQDSDCRSARGMLILTVLIPFVTNDQVACMSAPRSLKRSRTSTEILTPIHQRR